MRCIRCQGMMIEERVFTREGGLAMARCLHCGELIDTVVISNRDRSQPRFPNPRTRKVSLFGAPI